MLQSKLYMLPKRTLFLAPLKYLAPHSYGALVLYVGVYTKFSLKISENHWIECRCALVPAGVKHEIYVGDGVLGKIFIEPDTEDINVLLMKLNFKNRPFQFFDQQLIELFSNVYEQNMDCDKVGQCLDDYFRCDDLIKADSAIFKFDTRVRTAIQLIELNINENVRECEIANEVDLSESRFRHLFVEKVGVRYSQYRVWRRLVAAAGQLHSKDNLTHVAVEVGFTDLPHFSRYYKKTFGVNPSSVFKALNEFHLKA